MMRKILLATAAFAAASVPALAADLPSRKYEPAAPAAVYAPVFTWTGPYVGLNAGVGFHQSNNITVTDPILGTVATYSNGNNNGFVGGAQAGYNWQSGAIVFGGEADIQYANLGRDRSINGFAYGSRSSDNYFGTVRGRVGYAFDRALFYVTGGLAYGDIGSSWNKTTKAGWTLGGGVEYAFTNNWTAKIEGLYINIDRGSRALYDGSTGLVYTASKNSDMGVVRVGLNYKF